jgi:hypothetical protein
MNNLQTFLYAMAEGIDEIANVIESDFDYESSNLRGLWSQINAVAEETDDLENIDWQELDDRIGIDLKGIYGHQVILNGNKHGSVHTDLAEAEQHVKGLIRVNPGWDVWIKHYEEK